MKYIFITLIFLICFQSLAHAQTATPTHTFTPTHTPTMTATIEGIQVGSGQSVGYKYVDRIYYQRVIPCFVGANGRCNDVTATNPLPVMVMPTPTP